MNEEDKVALKIHGFLFSDSESESSSDNEESNSVEVLKTRVKSRLKTPSFTDSGQSSGLSDFDDDYYAVQPPPLCIKDFKDRIIKIKARPKTEAPVKNVWNMKLRNGGDATKDGENYQRGREVSFPSSTTSNEEFMYIPHEVKFRNSFNYLEEFPPLPRTSKEFPCLPKLEKNKTETNVGTCSSTSTHETFSSRLNSNCSSSSTGTIRKYSCLPEAPKGCLQEFKSLPQLNKNNRGDEINNKAIPCLSSEPMCLGVDILPLTDCLQELKSLPQLNKNKTRDEINNKAVECLPDPPTPLVVEYLPHLEPPPSPPEAPKDFLQEFKSPPHPRRDEINNKAVECLPDPPTPLVVEFLPHLESPPSPPEAQKDFLQEFKSLPHPSRRDEINNKAVAFLPDPPTPLVVEFLPSLEPPPSPPEAPKDFLQEFKSLPHPSRRNEINNKAVAFLPDPPTPLAVESFLHLEPPPCPWKAPKDFLQKLKTLPLPSKNKRRDKINNKACLPLPDPPIYKKTTAEGLNTAIKSKKLKVESHAPSRHKKESKPEKQNQATINKKVEKGPQNTIFDCDNMKVSDSIRHQRGRTNNSTLARVRLAGGKKQRRFYTQRYRLTDLAKDIFVIASILLFVFVCVFYIVTWFWNNYVYNNIFVTCNNNY